MAQLRIKSSRTPWRRGGVAFISAEPVEVERKRLSDAQYLQLLADPILTVEARASVKADWAAVADEEREAARLQLHGDGQARALPPAAVLRCEIRGPQDCIRMAICVQNYLEGHPEFRRELEEAMEAAFPLRALRLMDEDEDDDAGDAAGASTTSRGGRGGKAPKPDPAETASAADDPAPLGGNPGDGAGAEPPAPEPDPASAVDAAAEADARQDGGGDGGEG